MGVCTSHIQDENPSRLLTIAVVVHFARLHIVLMFVSLPLLICFPHGCTRDNGILWMISDGFKTNTAFSTALWGSGVAWINCGRYLGVATCSLHNACVSHICIPVATYAAFLTLRYDVLDKYHFIFAVLWIASSFIFHYSTTLGIHATTVMAKSCVFWIGVVFGSLFVILFVLFELCQGQLLLIANSLSSAISIVEILTVVCIMLLDFIQCQQVIGHYLKVLPTNSVLVLTA